jgi:hypothetical protein
VRGVRCIPRCTGSTPEKPEELIFPEEHQFAHWQAGSYFYLHAEQLCRIGCQAGKSTVTGAAWFTSYLSSFLSGVFLLALLRQVRVLLVCIESQPGEDPNPLLRNRPLYLWPLLQSQLSYEPCEDGFEASRTPFTNRRSLCSTAIALRLAILFHSLKHQGWRDLRWLDRGA